MVELGISESPTLLCAVLIVAPASHAATTCSFTPNLFTLTLEGDCTTDQTIRIPNGSTLDGAGYTITAVDPPGGPFLGAIVRNDGPFAAVRNLRLETVSLADECDADDDRLRGILFEGASGLIANNTVWTSTRA